jgi:hypothetical protein
LIGLAWCAGCELGGVPQCRARRQTNRNYSSYRHRLALMRMPWRRRARDLTPAFPWGAYFFIFGIVALALVFLWLLYQPTGMFPGK